MALYTPEYKPNGKEVAVITTDEGTIRVQLHGEDAPIHVGNFVELAQDGFYDGLKFHRYVPGFVIQGGCPNTRDMSAADVAAGKSGPEGMRVPAIPAIPSRASGRPTPTTRTRMALWQWHAALCPILPVASSTSALVPKHFLDTDYTVFGDTIEGLDVISKLRAGSVIENITIENAD